MGSVYCARDERTGQRVALKVLDARRMESADFDRFLREASILAGLMHPGIVRYVAHGISRDGAPYIAMEWVEGDTLAARLGEPLGLDETLVVVSGVADALGAAHARGVIHRDVKPSNVMLES